MSLYLGWDWKNFCSFINPCLIGRSSLISFWERFTTATYPLQKRNRRGRRKRRSSRRWRSHKKKMGKKRKEGERREKKEKVQKKVIWGNVKKMRCSKSFCFLVMWLGVEVRGGRDCGTHSTRLRAWCLCVETLMCAMGSVQCSAMWCSVVQYSKAHWNEVQCRAEQCSAKQHSRNVAVQRSTVQYRVASYRIYRTYTRTYLFSGTTRLSRTSAQSVPWKKSSIRNIHIITSAFICCDWYVLLNKYCVSQLARKW